MAKVSGVKVVVNMELCRYMFFCFQPQGSEEVAVQGHVKDQKSILSLRHSKQYHLATNHPTLEGYVRTRVLNCPSKTSRQR